MRKSKKFLAVALVALFMIALLPAFSLGQSGTGTAVSIATGERKELTSAVVGTYTSASITSWSWVLGDTTNFALYAAATGDAAPAANATSVYVGAKSGVTLTSAMSTTVKVTMGIKYASGSTSSPTTSDDLTWTVTGKDSTTTTTPPTTTPGGDTTTPAPIPEAPSVDAVNDLADAVAKASDTSSIADAIEKSGMDSGEQAAALTDEATADGIIKAAEGMDETILKDKGATNVTTSVTPSGNPDITFAKDDVIGLTTAAVLEDETAGSTFSGELKISEPDASFLGNHGHDSDKSVAVDIDLLVDGNNFTKKLKAAIYITFDVPAKIDLDKPFQITNYHDDGSSDTVPYRKNGNRSLTVLAIRSAIRCLLRTAAGICPARR